jgi:hypothetical protein
MSATLDWMSWVVRAMRKNLKLSYKWGNSGSKKCKRGYGGAHGGVWWSLRIEGVWALDSDGLFCVDEFGRNRASVAVIMFTHLIWFKKKFDKCCNFNAIYKINAAINCITIQHNRG